MEQLISARGHYYNPKIYEKVMYAYDKGLEGRMAEWAVKKYKSQRRLPDNINNEFFE